MRCPDVSASKILKPKTDWQRIKTPIFFVQTHQRLAEPHCRTSHYCFSSCASSQQRFSPIWDQLFIASADWRQKISGWCTTATDAQGRTAPVCFSVETLVSSVSCSSITNKLRHMVGGGAAIIPSWVSNGLNVPYKSVSKVPFKFAADLLGN